MKVVKEITAALPNTPGSLAKLCTALAKAKVNVQAISVVESTTVSVVRMVADKTAAAQKVIKEMGVTVSTKDVLALSLANKPGALGKAAVISFTTFIPTLLPSKGQGRPKTLSVLSLCIDAECTIVISGPRAQEKTRILKKGVQTRVGCLLVYRP